MLCRVDGIEHHGQVPAGGIFHASRHVKAADGQTVLLILHGTGADGHIGENIGDIPPVFRVEHFVRGGEPGFLDGPDVHFPHGDESGQKVGLFFRIRLVDDTLVAFPGGSWLVGVDPWDQDQLVLYLPADACQSGDIIADRVRVVGGAGADDDQEPVVLSGQHRSDFGIPGLFYLGESGGQRKLLPDFRGSGKFLDKFKAHGILTKILSVVYSSIQA